MRDTSRIARNKFYNLFQNLKMSPMRSFDELDSVPPSPGAFIFWIDEAPPRCLITGIASPKLEDGLLEEIKHLVNTRSDKSKLQKHLAADTQLSRQFKVNLKKPEERERFLREHTYFQYLTITDMKEDELKIFGEFLEQQADLHPRYSKNSLDAKTKGRKS